MPPLFQKLNLKSQNPILILNAPEDFQQHLEGLQNVTILRDLESVTRIHFALAFTEKKQELDRISALVAPLAEGDAILWFAYPKATSKKYHCDFNRDTGWDVLMAAGFRPIRQVAIDEDWSALRFRRVEFVKGGK